MPFRALHRDEEWKREPSLASERFFKVGAANLLCASTLHELCDEAQSCWLRDRELSADHSSRAGVDTPHEPIVSSDDVKCVMRRYLRKPEVPEP